MPCFIIGLALVESSASGNEPCVEHSVDWAELLLWCKGLLMLWDAVSIITQLVLTGHCGTSVSGSHERPDGTLEVETVASVLRSTAGSLRASSEPDPDARTRQWVQSQTALDSGRGSEVLIGGSE